ncbi:MAG TPA: sigma-70 family RNA polymerase sigma factor, partial [Microthrixaceae bacterium]|nr:sigma-70 family RNA polymerase sigma factor [Microthrixaceae bacterium]
MVQRAQVSETALTVDTALMADADLLAWRRDGDPVRVDAAMVELYRRHRGAARAVARRLVASGADVDDVVEDAFERVGRAISNGRGPTEDFRSYLMVAVRSSASTLHRDTARTQPTDVLEAVDVDDPSSLLLADLERSAAGRAFESLPERWRTVLWLVDVEGRPASEVAVILGIGANAVAALTYRAREGLRQGFLVAQAAELSDHAGADCASVRDVIGAYVRGRASMRDQARVERHVEHCDRCAAVLAEARDVNSTIMLSVAGLLVPVAAIAGLRAAPTWLASGGGARVAAGAAGAAGAGAAGAAGSKVALLGRHPVMAGAAAVTAVAAAVAAVVVLTAGPDDVSAGSNAATPTAVVGAP